MKNLNKNLKRKFKNTKWTGKVYEVKEWTWKGYTANELLTVVCFSFLITSIVWGYFYKPVISKINVVIPPRIDAKEEIVIERCHDPISCIRDVGEELGFSNNDIMIAIRIAKAESGMNPSALNKNSNGTFDIGLMQINDVHNKRISRIDRMDYEKNITFAYKLRQEQNNWNAWSVCNKKIINCN